MYVNEDLEEAAVRRRCQRLEKLLGVCVRALEPSTTLGEKALVREVVERELAPASAPS